MTSAVDNSLDAILVQLGDLGKYQGFMFGLICLSVILHSGVHVAYVFTAMDLDYRCEIPECDAINPKYDEPWLANAVPFSKGAPSKCERYKLKNNTIASLQCNDSDSWIPKETERCNSFVYKTRENSILREYNLQCEDNLWKLAMVGTVNNVGQFLGLFLSGMISDRFGRRVVLVWGLIFCGICGIARTFAPSYIWYLVFECLDATFGAGTYVCGFIMGVELVGPKKRVILGTLISSCYTVGEIIAAGSAWIFEDWRAVIYTLYAPPMLLIVYLWIIPESIRWNLSKGHVEEAKKTLRTVAKVNGKTISEDALDKLTTVKEKSPETTETLWDVFKSTTLMMRMINCCFCWITCTFLFYGLTLNSVALAGTAYLDFILTALVEIPAYIACVFIIEKFGRKLSLSGSYFITGVSCLIFLAIPSESHTATLCVYLLGKFGATAAFTVVYVATSEVFPTPQRHTLMGICSTIGRIGSMVSPQTPLLAQLWDPLPILMFSGMAAIAGFLALLLPETINTKLPDTIDEAIHIGKEKSSNSKLQ